MLICSWVRSSTERPTDDIGERESWEWHHWGIRKEGDPEDKRKGRYQQEHKQLLQSSKREGSLGEGGPGGGCSVEVSFNLFLAPQWNRKKSYQLRVRGIGEVHLQLITLAVWGWAGWASTALMRTLWLIWGETLQCGWGGGARWGGFGGKRKYAMEMTCPGPADGLELEV